MAPDVMLSRGASSELDAERAFLVHLRDIGRAAAAASTVPRFDDAGVRSAADPRETFRGARPARRP